MCDIPLLFKYILSRIEMHRHTYTFCCSSDYHTVKLEADRDLIRAKISLS